MTTSPTSSLRRRQVPDRIVGDKVVIARPGVDEALVLGGAAAAVWVELDHWTTIEEVESALAQAHPELDAADRSKLLDQALHLIEDEGLLERRRG